MTNKSRGPPPGLGNNNKGNLSGANATTPNASSGTNGWIGSSLSNRVGGSNNWISGMFSMLNPLYIYYSIWNFVLFIRFMAIDLVIIEKYDRTN